MTTAAPTTPERMEFKTELKQLLDLIIHSLYTKKEIFLRELISNAADAIDKLRFEALKQPGPARGRLGLEDQAHPRREGRHADRSATTASACRASTIVENLGTIARSGTRAFLENLKQADAQDRPELIGQFGVGFYASFMVADRVTVLSRAGGRAERGGAVGVATGRASSPSSRPRSRRAAPTSSSTCARTRRSSSRPGGSARSSSATPTSSSTRSSSTSRRRRTARRRPTEETLNSRQAIWLRPKSEVKEEEYNAFYKQLGHDDEDPLKTIHIAAEGGAWSSGRCCSSRPTAALDWMAGPEKKSGIDLYVRRVLIQHECEELVAAVPAVRQAASSTRPTCR